MNSSVANRRREQRRVPNDKRKRAAQACSHCKARKSKCIRSASGICQRCSRNALTCEYLQCSDSRVERDQLPPSRSFLQEQDLVTVNHKASFAASGGNLPTDACQAERFMWPGFLAKLRESFSLDPVPEVQHRFLEPSLVRPPVDQTLRAAELRRLKQATDAFPTRAVADHLLSALINYGTDSFFYFDQAELISEIDQFYNDPDSSLRFNTGFVCTAHAAFALGSQWTGLASCDRSVFQLDGDSEEMGRAFYAQSRLLIPDLDDSPSLRSIQAPLILGVYLLPARATGSLHMYLGLALRKALALDLHLNTEGYSTYDKEIRSRLWWAVFSLERLLTVKLNRPRSVDPSIIKVPLPQPLPELDNIQIYDNLMHQTASARLTLILDKLSDSSTWTDSSDAAVQARALLKDWKRSLPACLRLENSPPASASYRATFHLHLNYYFAWIAMGKYKVVATVRASLRRASGPDPVPTRHDNDSAQLTKSCIKAARKMLELFGRIDKSGKLTMSSFTDFQGCSIATMILLVAGIVERDVCYDARLSFGFDCLRRMAGNHVTTATGVRFMEVLQSIAEEAAKKLEHAGMANQQPVAEQMLSATAPSMRDALLSPMLPLESSNFMPWEPAQSVPLPVHDAWSQHGASRWASGEETEDEPFWYSQLDNDAFLMEITGLDVLGISGS